MWLSEGQTDHLNRTWEPREPKAKAGGSEQASENVVEGRTACLDRFGEIGAWLWGIPHTFSMFHGLTYTLLGRVAKGERQY